MERTIFLLAHQYAYRILLEYKGSYSTAFKIGLAKARYKLNLQ